MLHAGRSLARILLGLLLVLPLGGCEWKALNVQLQTFFSAGVDELHFWRDDGSGSFVRAGHMRFSPLEGPPGARVLRYTMVSPEGEESLTLTSPADVNGDSIIVNLWFARWPDPGMFRVSARNAAGESELSEQEIPL